LSAVKYYHRCLEHEIGEWLARGWTEVARVPVLSLIDERDCMGFARHSLPSLNHRDTDGN